MGKNSHHQHGHHTHVVPLKVFTNVLIALLILTVITVAAAQVDFGEMNLVVALLIASLKASLVIWFFMHGAHESKIIWTYILIPFILLAIMVGGTFTDDPFRMKFTGFGGAGNETPATSTSGGHH